MAEIKSQEDLMAWIMNQLAAKLPGHAILKGGMLLRLLDSPRSTNDLDYVFIPYKSKKDVLPLIEKALLELEGVNISATFNSKALRIIVTHGKYSVQVEANTAENCPSEEMSTSALAQKAGLLPRIIRVMRYDVALAHKLAAWNERDLVRDLYDTYFLHSHLRIVPDEATLKARLEKINPAKNKPPAKSMTRAEFLGKLEARAEALTQDEVEEELRPILAAEDLAGLALRIKTGVFRLTQKMRTEEKE